MRLIFFFLLQLLGFFFTHIFFLPKLFFGIEITVHPSGIVKHPISTPIYEYTHWHARTKYNARWKSRKNIFTARVESNKFNTNNALAAFHGTADFFFSREISVQIERWEWGTLNFTDDLSEYFQRVVKYYINYL